MNKPIRLLIVDDHTLVREGMRAFMETRPEVEVIGEAGDGFGAVEKERTLKPDVILLDLVMPGKDGLTAIQEIKQANPDARILVLTSFTDDDKVFPAIKAGALGYLLKDSTSEELIQAIQLVAKGEASLHPTIARKLMREINRPSTLPPTPDPLTSREVEVLDCIAKGLSNNEIASELIISDRTVNAHVSNILKKLHLANRTQAALYALQKKSG